MLEQETNVTNPDEEIAFDVTEADQPTTVDIETSEEGEVAKIQEEPQREHEEYSAKVKKRLDKLTAKMREAERREQAALQYANSVQQQLAVMQQRAHQLDKGYLTESEGRISSQMSIVEANLEDAVAKGDGKTAVEAQKLLSQLILQQERIKTAKAQSLPPPAAQNPLTAAQANAQPRPPDPKAQEWAGKHEWFGTDKVMTRAAYSIHEDLAAEGFDLSSDEYYDELDERLRKEFPHKFRKIQADMSSVQPVAPATRGISVPSGRRQVKLTPSEVAMARRIGVPLEEYAKHVRR